MSIPFYRYVEYMEDGHYLYQCLQCGAEIDTGYHYLQYSPRFCCYCGVEYKGFILPKEKEYISRPGKEKIEYYIEKGFQWSIEDEISWDGDWRKTSDYKVALKYLNDTRREIEYNAKKDKHPLGINHCRLSYRHKRGNSQYIVVDKDKYYKKTGKKFKKRDYAALMPWEKK